MLQWRKSSCRCSLLVVKWIKDAAPFSVACSLTLGCTLRCQDCTLTRECFRQRRNRTWIFDIKSDMIGLLVITMRNFLILEAIHFSRWKILYLLSLAIKKFSTLEETDWISRRYNVLFLRSPKLTMFLAFVPSIAVNTNDQCRKRRW